MLMLATIGLVLGFQSADRLGSAYGLAVSADMAITTILATVVAMRRGWNLFLVFAFVCIFVCIDIAFLGANLFKIVDGGWYPLLLGAVVFTIMVTWSHGRRILRKRLFITKQSLNDYLQHSFNSIKRLPGTAVFLTSRIDKPPSILLHHLSHHHVVHEQVILLNIHIEEAPKVSATNRISVSTFIHGFYSVQLNYGYMQSPNLPVALRECAHLGLNVDPDHTTYYLGRETLIPKDDDQGMMLWRERLFVFLSQNALRATAFYNIPPEQVVEMGIQIEL
jgi:KUP system potassium uptake protein